MGTYVAAILGVVAQLLLLLAVIAGLFGTRHLALWLFGLSIVLFVFGGFSWLDGYWRSHDGESNQDQRTNDQQSNQDRKDDHNSPIMAANPQGLHGNTNPSTRDDQPQQSNQPRPQQLRPIEIGNLMLTIGLLLVTAIAAVIYLSQAIIMRDQLEQATKTTTQTQQMIAMSQAEQRAWIAVVDSGIDRIGVGNPLNSKVTLANSGKTPGYVHKGDTRFRVLKPGDNIDSITEQLFATARTTTYELTIAAGDTKIALSESGETLTPELNQKMIGKTESLLLVCLVQYNGVLTQGHETAACFVYADQRFRQYGGNKYNYMK